MSWQFRYQLLSAPTPRDDGSRDVLHALAAQAKEDEGEWETVPSHSNKQVPVDADALEVVLDMPDDTGPERVLKNTAYKELLVSSIDRTSVPVTGWTAAILELIMENNQQSATQATDANDYITVTLGLSYPVPFTL